ncbi:MAG: pyridoxamine 5-phosphate oxidase, partial [Mycobacterium sp.]|nr:pyridoxamine 5-phosphate oxidase [Mycobacterium sp.]
MKGGTRGRSVKRVISEGDEQLARMRVEYGSVEKDGSPDLDADWLGPDQAAGWVALLRKWLADAHAADVAEPNAMVVGTVDAAGRPVTRTVLCKSVHETG